MVAWLKLIRWPNLLMIVLIQYLIRFSLLEALGLPYALDHLYFAMGVLCSVALAAGGYIINDLYDLEVDAINKSKRVTIGKQISENLAWNSYYVSVFLAVGLAYFLAQKVNLDNLWMIAPLAAVLLYLYAYDLKRRPLIGNLLVALLSAMPVFLVGVFDVLPAHNGENAEAVQQSLYIIGAYSLFAFWLSLIREILKDAEDQKGDLAGHYRTLPLVLSTFWWKSIVVVMIGAAIAVLVFYQFDLWATDKIAAGYLNLSVVLPLAYLAWLSVRGQSSKDFHRASTLSKLIMLGGILTMPVFTLSLLYQWP